MRKQLLLSAVIALAIFGTISLVKAPPAIYYNADSNYHGIDCPLGASPTVTATTNDPAVTRVTFVWHLPDGTIDWIDWNVPVTTVSGVSTAQSTHMVDMIGDWGVQALFQVEAPGGAGFVIGEYPISGVKATAENWIHTRSTSINVIPEVPVIGTIGALSLMLAGFTYKMKRKPHN